MEQKFKSLQGAIYYMNGKYGKDLLNIDNAYLVLRSEEAKLNHVKDPLLQIRDSK